VSAKKSKSRDEKGKFLVGHDQPGPGRNSLYSPEMNEAARKLALLGLADEEMAEYFGVTRQTFDNWKREYPAFFAALMEGKTIADANVADSLYRRATGEHIEFQRAFKNKDTGEVEIVTLKTWNPGDPGAAKLWLANRRPRQWREGEGGAGTVNIQININGKDTGLL
jgi:hypothetical protein